MKRQDCINNIMKFSGGSGFLTVGELAAYLGVNRNTAARWFKDVEYLSIGREKKYYAGDIADWAMQHRMMGAG